MLDSLRLNSTLEVYRTHLLVEDTGSIRNNNISIIKRTMYAVRPQIPKLSMNAFNRHTNHVGMNGHCTETKLGYIVKPKIVHREWRYQGFKPSFLNNNPNTILKNPKTSSGEFHIEGKKVFCRAKTKNCEEQDCNQTTNICPQIDKKETFCHFTHANTIPKKEQQDKKVEELPHPSGNDIKNQPKKQFGVFYKKKHDSTNDIGNEDVDTSAFMVDSVVTKILKKHD